MDEGQPREAWPPGSCLRQRRIPLSHYSWKRGERDSFVPDPSVSSSVHLGREEDLLISRSCLSISAGLTHDVCSHQPTRLPCPLVPFWLQQMPTRAWGLSGLHPLGGVSARQAQGGAPRAWPFFLLFFGIRTLRSSVKPNSQNDTTWAGK